MKIITLKILARFKHKMVEYIDSRIPSESIPEEPIVDVEVFESRDEVNLHEGEIGMLSGEQSILLVGEAEGYTTLRLTEELPEKYRLLKGKIFKVNGGLQFINGGTFKRIIS